MRKFTLTLQILVFSTVIFSQSDSMRNSTHIFWSDQYRIEMDDFENTSPSTLVLRNCENYNLCWGAYTGLFSVMDIPKKRRDKKTKIEAIYFAPAFEVKTSYRTNSDTMEYLKQVLIFDMYEWAARICRMELDSIYHSNPSIGIKGIFFKTVEADVQKRLGMMIKIYTQEVYIDNLEGAFKKWFEIVDNLLEETKEYKTTAIDRLRFIKKQPILEGYVKARKVIGSF